MIGIRVIGVPGKTLIVEYDMSDQNFQNKIHDTLWISESSYCIR